MIPKRLHDPILTISPSLYSVCIALRVSIAWVIWHMGRGMAMNQSIQTGLTVFAGMIVAFFVYKIWYNPHSWKNYWRTIVLWTFMIGVIKRGQPDWNKWVALLVLLDVVMGQQSWYIAQWYV